MESLNRKPFQGLSNIVRFNWHFYLLAILLLSISLFLITFLSQPLKQAASLIIILIAASIFLSLLVSCYIYDFSGLYKFEWFSKLAVLPSAKILNIHAGFDESSAFIRNYFRDAELKVFDFYAPEKHTEVSIKRARKTYGSFPGTVSMATEKIPVENASVDLVFLILAAHEIRNEKERSDFFKELKRTLKPGGMIVVTEHQRDLVNFLAYNIGFFHFHSHTSWLKVFESSGLILQQEIKNTPFISTFILKNA